MSAAELVALRAVESDIPIDDVRGRSRDRAVVRLRAWIAAELRSPAWGLSLPEVGKALGGRHHSTVLDLVSDARRRAHRPPLKKGGIR